jgi:hypothetical protein
LLAYLKDDLGNMALKLTSCFSILYTMALVGTARFRIVFAVIVHIVWQKYELESVARQAYCNNRDYCMIE